MGWPEASLVSNSEEPFKNCGPLGRVELERLKWTELGIRVFGKITLVASAKACMSSAWTHSIDTKVVFKCIRHHCVESARLRGVVVIVDHLNNGMNLVQLEADARMDMNKL